ncbi:TPA: flagellar motor protein [Candidatus Sumerlaeota bacterium]|jgi:chemotaxis protein MotA|nr:flagellar motor protein [Candidatus Sumerlaeota bacterium]
MDIASIVGIFLGVAMILGGNAMEGGKVSSMIGIPAAIIVFGGAMGAILLQFPPKTLIGALTALKVVFLGVKMDPPGQITQIVDFARRARREGILALEKEIPNITDPFFSKALGMAVDGLEPKTLFETMETEMGTIEEEWKEKAEVWETAGGYLPTVGIIGAVLGLIVVMGNLSDINKVGHGIASAFVATIYGVGMANLICLPFGGKIKAAGKSIVKFKEMTLKGVLLIQEGINHSIIEEELKGFLDEGAKKKLEKAGGGGKE